MRMKQWGLILICALLVGCSQSQASGTGKENLAVLNGTELNENCLSDEIIDDVNDEKSENDKTSLTDNEGKSSNSSSNSNSSSKTNQNDKSSEKTDDDTSSKNQEETIKTEVKDVDIKEETEDKTKKEEIKQEEVIEEKVLTSSLSQNAVDLINQKRTEAGLNTLSYSSYLGEIALERAKQIVNDFSHNKFYSQYQSTDYKLGECIAYGYGSSLNAVNGWMASSSHRNTLMDPENTTIAVAYCGEYWVAIVRY